MTTWLPACAPRSEPRISPAHGYSVELPLVVDLDGTLVVRDTLLILLRRVLWKRPSSIASFVWRGRRSRADAKRVLWTDVGINVARLPYSEALMNYLGSAFARGRRLVLVTGADQGLADAVAAHTGIFESAHGSSHGRNLTGQRKAAFLQEMFGIRGFDYAGNSAADLPVWSCARAAVVCNAPRRVVQEAHSVASVAAVFDDRWYRGPGPQHLIAHRAIR